MRRLAKLGVGLLTLALVFVPATARTQDKGDKGPTPAGKPGGTQITIAELKTMLTGMGYGNFKEVKDSKGEVTSFSLTVSIGTWTVPIIFSLSGNKEYIWMETGLIPIEKPESIPAKAMLGLLTANNNIAYFGYSEAGKKFELKSFLRNHNVIPVTLRLHIESYTRVFQDNEKFWNPKKWS